MPLTTCQPYGGPIWHSKPLGKHLVIACEDGSIKIAKIRKGKIEVVKSLIKRETPCLCLDIIAGGEEDHGVKSVYAGYSDGALKKWDVDTGNSVLHIETGKDMLWCLELF